MVASSKEEMNAIIIQLTGSGNDRARIFKEEFVTCGGST